MTISDVTIVPEMANCFKFKGPRLLINYQYIDLVFQGRRFVVIRGE